MTDAKALEEGVIVQIVNEEHHWFPALIIVDEVKSFGLQGYCIIPSNDGNTRNAYIRLKKGDFEIVGLAHFVVK